ncbi:MAG: CapA family protein [Bacteroidota bacterium]
MRSSPIRTACILALLLGMHAPGRAAGILSPRERPTGGIMLEDFDDGSVTLGSYPGEDMDPSGWTLDGTVTHGGSPFALKLTGNTWKTESITPVALDSGDVWSVAVRIGETGEGQGFGVMDSQHTLLFAFSGSEELDIALWVTADQGAHAVQVWHELRLPVADEWLARYGYLPRIDRIVFVNDRDGDPTSVIWFDDVRDVTPDLPSPPQVSITWTAGPVGTDAQLRRTVGIQFQSHISDPDSGSHTFLWLFGDGASGIEPHPFHTYVLPDDHSYTVVLEAEDEDGLVGRASASVAVDSGSGSFPLRMNFVGDIMLARGYEAPGGIIPTQGVNAIFAPTRSFLGGSADITVANLECSLTQSTSVHPTKPIVFKGSPANAEGLAWAGIDLVTIANNHILDYGLAGLQETQAAVRARGIGVSGAGADAYEASLPLFRSARGLSTAFLAFSDRTGQYNNYQPYLNAGENKPGFANLTLYEAARQIRRVRDCADLVVAELHSGSEYSLAPDRSEPGMEEDFHPGSRMPAESDREQRRAVLDAGADLVICHHPHIIHGFEVYRGRLIAHSLGNFAFDLGYGETYPSVILNAAADQRGFHEFTVVPVYIDDFIPRRAQGELGLRILDYLAMRSRELGTILILDRDSVRAWIALDTTVLVPRFVRHRRSLPLAASGPWRVSAPDLLAGDGSIAAIPSLSPPGSWSYRLGRETVWFGNAEDEGCTLWELSGTDEQYDTSEARSGRRSIRQRRSAGTGAIQTTLETRLLLDGSVTGYSLCGWIKTGNARSVVVRVKFYASRTGFETGSADIAPEVNGTTGWTFYCADITPPAGALFADLVLESRGPSAGTGYAWFDDISLAAWTAWTAHTPATRVDFPNDFRWLQVRTSSSVETASLIYSEGSYGDITEPAGVEVELAPGWNMVSNPARRPDSSNTVAALFPHAGSTHCYSFDPAAGYRQEFAMANGAGYWLRSASAATELMGGGLIWEDSIRVVPGWNMIGSLSLPVDTSVVTSDPPGIRGSLFYGYAGAYAPASGISPGRAYWVKANAAGRLVLNSSIPRPCAHTPGGPPPGTLEMRDARRGMARLYWGAALPPDLLEAPPPPPEGIMDVRFASNTLFASAEKGGTSAHAIRISGAVYPLRLAWDGSGPRGAFLRTDAATHDLSSRGGTTIPSPQKSLLLLVGAEQALPDRYDLEQNYPNPFNPATTLRYAMPHAGHIRLGVYDITGRLVRTLADGWREAGYHDAVWDGRLPGGAPAGSGVYFCRLETPGASMVRKMILLR